MKKYFVISDMHSFYDEMIRSLDKKGFDINNQDHILVVCGDMFDRGHQPLEVYNFLRGLPKERRILIRGNHETLLRDLVERGHAEWHDESNGTYATLFYLVDLDREKIRDDYYKQAFLGDNFDPLHEETLRKEYEEKLNSVFHTDIIKEILAWVASDEWVNYWETNKYIFCHAWIPLNQQIDWNLSRKTGYVEVEAEFYRDDWRNATQTEWEDAMWFCPWKKAKEKLNQTGKTIVCGHWHTSDFYNHLTKQRKGKYECPIFNSKRYKLIGLDACTVISQHVNVLVLDEDEL